YDESRGMPEGQRVYRYRQQCRGLRDDRAYSAQQCGIAELLRRRSVEAFSPGHRDPIVARPREPDASDVQARSRDQPAEHGADRKWRSDQHWWHHLATLL